MSISNFTAAVWLAFLLVPVAIAIVYIVVQRRRKKQVLRFANMEQLEKVATPRLNPLRHAPIALMLAGLICFTLAAAGPSGMDKVPRNRATVMLAIDVSLSMEATDVTPSRIAVAKDAAKRFIDGLTPGINVGLVTFAGTASVQVSPTTNKEAMKHAIDNMKLAERTATGEGIFTSLQAIDNLASVIGGAQAAPPARVVLMSDGKQTVPAAEDVDNPRHEFVAARLAKEKHVPVSTISFGTAWGKVDIPDPDGKGSQMVPVPVDDDALREVAKLAGGDFFTASSLEDLRSVYDTLDKQIGYEEKWVDKSRPWLILSGILFACGLVTSLVVRQRIP